MLSSFETPYVLDAYRSLHQHPPNCQALQEELAPPMLGFVPNGPSSQIDLFVMAAPSEHSVLAAGDAFSVVKQLFLQCSHGPQESACIEIDSLDYYVVQSDAPFYLQSLGFQKIDHSYVDSTSQELGCLKPVPLLQVGGPLTLEHFLDTLPLDPFEFHRSVDLPGASTQISLKPGHPLPSMSSSDPSDHPHVLQFEMVLASSSTEVSSAG